jgi:regulation of enolase protein 1 (concanavalin A-like superfamily)
MNGLFRAAASALWIFVCLATSLLPASAQSAAWNSVDVGAPQLSGSTSQSGSTFTVSGAGADVWDTHDEFQFVHQRVTGDFDLQARVDTLTEAHWWSKAGVMVRNSLQGDSPHGFVLVSGGSGTAFQRRRTAGAESVHTDGPFAGAPYWVKVSRRGSTLLAYVSADGSSWTPVGSDTIALGETVYAGLAVTSHEVTARATATFSAVVLSPAAVPSGMSNVDVGAPAIPGSVQHASGTYTITGAGTDIWDTADQFHFVYQSVTGDFDVRGRVASLQNTDIWAKAGLMIRESLAPGSKHAFAAVTGGAGFAFQRRTETNGVSDHTDGAWTTAPGWVRLVRQAASVEAFHSSDGTAWRSMGRIPIALANTVLVGMAVTSHNAGRATVAEVDRLTITAGGSTGNASPSITVAAPADGATFQAGTAFTVTATATDPDGQVARVDFFANGASLGSDASAPFSVQAASLAAGTHVLTAQATDNAGATALSAPITITVTAPSSGLPSGLTGSDIGNPSLAGSVSYASGTYTVQAAGRDIWSAADQFYFIHRQMTGDVDIRARVGSLLNTHPWAKAGVMIRSSLAAGATHAFMALTPDYGYALQHRPVASGESIHTAGADGRAPAWVRLTRIGTTLEGYQSPDGVNWSSMGRVTIPMGQTIYVGLAVASTTESQRTVATFTDVTAAAAAASGPDPEPSPEPEPEPLPAPRAVAFVASADHATLVTRYELEVFAAAATPGSSSPIASLDLGKPSPSGGEITVDCSAFFAALPPGSYQATVTAIGSSGSGRSASVAFSK